MKKRVISFLLIIVSFAILLISIYIIDMNRMKENKPVLFSTWGYDYAPPEVLGKIVSIQDKTVDGSVTCAMALEKIFEDYENEYYLSCIKSSYIIVRYENGYEENIKDALSNGNISLTDLDTFNIHYITQAKEKEGQTSFIGTVLETSSTYIIVKPNEDESEFKSSDKISVGWVYKQGACYVGSKVQVIYSGEIMETYPARISGANIIELD